MKTYALLLAALLLSPLSAMAADYLIPDSTLTILNSYSLVSAILVGLATSILVLINARKMKGGVFGSVLNQFALGMFFVLVGFLLVSIPWQIGSPIIVKTAHDVLYILGYIIMAVAANKLLRAIRG